MFFSNIVKFVATFSYFGYLPKLPGTFGTFGALLLYLLLVNFLEFNHLMILFTTICIIAISVVSSSYAINIFNSNDPKEVVIDEVAGFFVSILFIPFESRYIILAFILFRLFDISKPFIIKKLEKLPKGWGITMDDVGAGVLTNLIIQIMIY